MPVPVRNDGTPGPTRRAIFFVHGFMSKESTWDPLLALLRADDSVTAEFDLHTFPYETALGSIPVLRRLPTPEEIGKSLASWLVNQLLGPDGRERYIDLTLVGHSMGGLVIQCALLDLLTPARPTSVLSRIRQVILFATPNFGSTTLSGVRSVASVFLDNPQERALRRFSAESSRIHEAIRDRVIQARFRKSDEYPIPFYCFWGSSDAVVPPESAQGYLPSGEALPGDHFTVHCPSGSAAPCYRQFVEALRQPYGHPNIWEVERFSMSVKVDPATPGSEVMARYGTKQRLVTYDNVAAVRRQAEFSRHNRCREPYQLKYGTRNGGWIVPHMSDPHVTPPEMLRLYEDNGYDAYYVVNPEPGTTATLDLTVYKGFDAGHRDFHMHFGQQTVFRRTCFDVDLSVYRRNGWDIVPPRLYFHPSDAGHDEMCARREKKNPDPPVVVDDAGIWKWELEFITEGVVDIVWDVVPSQAVRTQPLEIHLAPGEHAIFGYGSLLSIASLERTLGRSYRRPFIICSVDGWRRRWNVAMPNELFSYQEADGWVTPERIVYLNVERQADARVNGVLFVVDAAELERFDKREWIYERVDVTSALTGVTVDGGAAWIYCGKPEYVRNDLSSPRTAAIRATYLQIIDNGHRGLGSEFVRDYDRSTDPVPKALVVADVRRDDMMGP